MREPNTAGGPAVTPEADRRDSGRVPLELLVRDAALGGSFEPRRGNLALGGVYFDGLHPPAGSRFELRFILPGHGGEIRAVAEVLGVTREDERFGTHLRFVEIPLDAELAIARFLQQA
ncbi:type IV pilus assembly PilZ [Anaeromyxobacter dehalogenans 2CP-1]|uniref:Type IV pilus assembly PilZ n=1 Tax=Anaeromyxobacter dehalogenans (strain ATCC BAA-258 / DSM 21875 / 2CP-1) TaxID=455488 RepID=B8JCY2_ANAD2|nr:PilZ domain-containing protein [Anaeromyxobacter dehalogenans]ACL64010.1 type IV pilus assembly PilZ [Anaeromyxobacter dehalogenans 2CP-1]